MKLKCPYCIKENRKSNLYSSPGGMSTCLGWSPGYYSEDGTWVQNEDPNYHVTKYTCSNGHHIEVTEHRDRKWIGGYLVPTRDRIWIEGEESRDELDSAPTDGVPS